MELNQNFNLASKQEQKQTQKQELVMTPQLRQSIELLQLSALDLQEHINDKLMDNPLLELEAEYEPPTDNYTQKDEYNYEDFIAQKVTLNEFLLQQLQLITINRQERKIGEQIIGSLDQYGFFTELEAVSKELKVSEEKVKEVLTKLKEIAPSGIASSGWKEALLVELEELSINYSSRKIELAKKIINNYLEELKNNKFKKIAKQLKIKPKVAQQLGDLINSLNPVPRTKFNEETASNYLQPDIIIDDKGSDYVIIMTEESFPTLRINSKYRRLLEQKETEEIQDYLKEKLDSALWLIKSLEQRRRTIYKIVKEIVTIQSDFLESGIKFLHPLSMAEVADRIDKHESTVSRATDDKYVQTNYGLFSLKFFFSEGLKNGDREISVISIKEYLKEIISEEDKTSPLSDQKLAEQLADYRIEISRRTVAKYRKELGIPSSRQRKRYK